MSTAGTTPAPGRPGRAAATRESAALSHPTGYEPEKLDGAIVKYLAVAESSIRHAESLGKRVEKTLEALEQHESAPGSESSALEKADLLTTLFDRQSKAALNIVKATDELSRLRSFVAGGPDTRPDLTVRGEIELRAILIAGVARLGLRVVDQAGNVIDTEALPA